MKIPANIYRHLALGALAVPLIVAIVYAPVTSTKNPSTGLHYASGNKFALRPPEKYAARLLQILLTRLTLR